MKFDSPKRSKSPSKTTDDMQLNAKPMRGMFTITTIQPTNTYKKIVNQCSDKILQRDNCNMLNSYFVVSKHNLFDCKSAISIKLLPQNEAQKKQVMNLTELKRHLTTLEYFIKNLKKINEKRNSQINADELPEPIRSYFL